MDPISFSAWMIYLKNNPERLNRFSDCFWPSQLISKTVAKNILEPHLVFNFEKKPIFIFGGWYGVLAQILHDCYPNTYYTIDVDPECEEVVNGVLHTIEHMIHLEVPDIIPITADMAEYEYPVKPYMVINTSTEHVSQEIYNTWWNNIPSGTKYLLQGNNFFSNEEHIRCCETEEEFLNTQLVKGTCWESQTTYCGMLPDGNDFNRFTAFGVKE